MFYGPRNLPRHAGDKISAPSLGTPRGKESALKTAVKTVNVRVLNP